MTAYHRDRIESFFEYVILYDREINKYVIEEKVDGVVQYATTFTVWSEVIIWLNNVNRVERLLGLRSLPRKS
jgi:hypothetical protein